MDEEFDGIFDGIFDAFIEFERIDEEFERIDEEFERIDEEFMEEFERIDEEFMEEFDSISGRGATTKRITAATRMLAGSMDGVLSNSTHLLGAHGK